MILAVLARIAGYRRSPCPMRRASGKRKLVDKDPRLRRGNGTKGQQYSASSGITNYSIISGSANIALVIVRETPNKINPLPGPVRESRGGFWGVRIATEPNIRGGNLCSAGYQPYRFSTVSVLSIRLDRRPITCTHSPHSIHDGLALGLHAPARARPITLAIDTFSR